MKAKRKRFKVECLKCGSIFNHDFKKQHQEKVHNGISLNIKHVGTNVFYKDFREHHGAPENPFQTAVKTSKVAGKRESICTWFNNYETCSLDSVATASQCQYLIALGPHQPKLTKYPVNTTVINIKQHSFNPKWYNEYPLLEYSIVTDSAYCFVCTLFSNGPGRSYQNSAWVKPGVCQWHKMKSCGVKKLGKLQHHFCCFSHKAALHDYYEFMTTENHNDIILNVSNRKEAIKTLSRQGLAFRGDGDESGGNFMQFVQLLSRHNPLLKRWIEESSLRSHNQGKSVERLLEIEKGNDKTGSDTASQIVNILESNLLNPELIPFQSYDFASNMSGKFNGTHVKLSELVGHKIMFIPCQAHRLNMFLERSCDASSIIGSTLNILENLYVFFSSSNKRYGLLNEKISKIENALQLRNLSKTRWTARAESVKAVWNSLEAAVESLDEILLLNECFDKGTRSKALALRKQILSFDFIVSISFMKNIMYKLKYLTETLEAKNLSIIDAITLNYSTMKILASINSDDYAMNNFINSAKEFSTLLGIDSEADF
ncbi:uncharacterized protein LOC136081550 [Hydra vulgaris]|uniref:Uncharacterized protein LOC136081550 n=1 Tax=Hydra vulgaris TaxID=6087 RepID=A0ABM4C083_HYDVU